MEGFLNPDKVLKQLKLRDEIVVVDFGCGSGGWVLPLARKIEERKIYAVDILEEPLSALRARAELEKISTIQTILADLEDGVDLPDGSCDLVLITNLLFEVDDKKFILKEGKRVLKRGGKILVVDWKKDSPLGPQEGRISSQEVKKIAKELKLKLEQEFPAGDYHYALVFD